MRRTLIAIPLAATVFLLPSPGSGSSCETISPASVLPEGDACQGWVLDGEVRTAGTIEELMGIIDGGAILYGNHGFVSAAFQNYLGEIGGSPVAASVSLYNQATAANAEALYDDPQSGTGEPVPGWTGSGGSRILVGFGTTLLQFHEECFYASILVVSAEEDARATALCMAGRVCSLIRGAVPNDASTWGSIKAAYR